jgi:hypothetical protein
VKSRAIREVGVMKAVGRLGVVALGLLAAAAPAAASGSRLLPEPHGCGNAALAGFLGAIPGSSFFDPGTIVLLGTGLMGLLAYSRRRKSSKR